MRLALRSATAWGRAAVRRSERHRDRQPSFAPLPELGRSVCGGPLDGSALGRACSRAGSAPPRACPAWCHGPKTGAPSPPLPSRSRLWHPRWRSHRGDDVVEAAGRSWLLLTLPRSRLAELPGANAGRPSWPSGTTNRSEKAWTEDLAVPPPTLRASDPRLPSRGARLRSPRFSAEASSLGVSPPGSSEEATSIPSARHLLSADRGRLGARGPRGVLDAVPAPSCEPAA